MTTFTNQKLNGFREKNNLNIIQITLKVAPVVIFVGFLGTNVFLVSEDLDPVYLFLKYFPLYERIIELIIGLQPNSNIKMHWILYPSRITVTFLGCLLFWGGICLTTLALGTWIMLVQDMITYLIQIANGSVYSPNSKIPSTVTTEQFEISGYLIRLIIHRYKQTQIFVRAVNDLVKRTASVWMMCGNTLTIVLAFASIRYMHTMDFLYLVYMPVLSVLLNLGTYVLLGMIADLAAFPERLILECKRKVKERKNLRLIKSLYKFRLKFDQVNIRRSFITAYFKHCLDNIATLLLSTR